MSKSSISCLQEHCSRKRFALPVYNIEDQSLPSKPSIFKCSCLCVGKTTSATSSSKKSAKERSAELMLKELGIGEPEFAGNEVKEGNATDSSSQKTIGNYVGELNEYCAKQRFPYPNYLDTEKIGDHFHVTCTHQSATSKGSASTKKEAKQRAAHKMLQEIGLASRTPNPTQGATGTGLPRASTAAAVENDEPTQPDVLLNRYSSENSLARPVYEFIEQDSPHFLCRCDWNNNTSEATGPSKETAMQNVAALILEGLQENSTDADYIGLLHQFCAKRGIDPATYSEVNDESSSDNTFVYSCSCNFKTLVATGPSQEAGKQNVAAKMLTYLKGLEEERCKEPFQNYVGQLNEYCIKYRWGLPNYSEIYNGESLVMVCTVETTTTTGIGKNKQQAKHQSANSMLRILRQSVKNGSNPYFTVTKNGAVPKSEFKPKIESKLSQCEGSKRKFGVACKEECQEGLEETLKKEIEDLYDISKIESTDSDSYNDNVESIEHDKVQPSPKKAKLE